MLRPAESCEPLRIGKAGATKVDRKRPAAPAMLAH
jgi:hypothetical protein